ncbi:MAG: adenylate/guanylate cyclase domain-containing protein [Gallionella sp.]|nr:adenylate/guanylate cyclase domain-containing protein [Gallionella sp.]
MEDRGNKTIMCSVLFLDIVEYSKKSVTGQISLKDRFNAYISAAISDVPVADRIILDTGDGAAINFLGDVEDALKAALSVRESLLNEDPAVEPPLLVRMGVNLGPVRLVRDINGQPNIVGDGINVAQRVMGFADASQVLVSRSYYDAVSRLSPQYAGMFHYQGSRTDKHVREHEIYAIGYPGECPAQSSQANATFVKNEGVGGEVLESIKSAWMTAAAKLDGILLDLLNRFRSANPKQRMFYLALPVIILITVSVLLFRLLSAGDDVDAGDEGRQILAGDLPVSAVLAQVAASSESDAGVTTGPKVKVERIADELKAPVAKKSSDGKTEAKKPISKHPTAVPQETSKSATSGSVSSWFESKDKGTEGYITVLCKDGAQVFVDGTLKGKTVSGSFTAGVMPGSHVLIVTHPAGGMYNQKIEIVTGKTVRFKPGFCD